MWPDTFKNLFSKGRRDSLSMFIYSIYIVSITTHLILLVNYNYSSLVGRSSEHMPSFGAIHRHGVPNKWFCITRKHDGNCHRNLYKCISNLGGSDWLFPETIANIWTFLQRKMWGEADQCKLKTWESMAFVFFLFFFLISYKSIFSLSELFSLDLRAKPFCCDKRSIIISKKHFPIQEVDSFHVLDHPLDGLTTYTETVPVMA